MLLNPIIAIVISITSIVISVTLIIITGIRESWEAFLISIICLCIAIANTLSAVMYKKLHKENSEKIYIDLPSPHRKPQSYQGNFQHQDEFEINEIPK